MHIDGVTMATFKDMNRCWYQCLMLQHFYVYSHNHCSPKREIHKSMLGHRQSCTSNRGSHSVCIGQVGVTGVKVAWSPIFLVHILEANFKVVHKNWDFRYHKLPEHQISHSTNCISHIYSVSLLIHNEVLVIVQQIRHTHLSLCQPMAHMCVTRAT